MKLGTANIQNFPDHPPRQVAQDARAVAMFTTLAGLQEIQPHEDTPVVRDALAESGKDWWMVGSSREVPVIGRADRWELLDHHVVPFDRPHLPRPENPHGGIVSVIVRSVKRPKLPPFAMVNTHLVAGGMNGPKVPVVAERWRVEWDLYRDEALRLFREGLTVFTVGDLNNPRPPTKLVDWLSPQASPDHLGQIVHTDSVELVNATHTREPLNSDHDLHVVSGALAHAGRS